MEILERGRPLSASSLWRLQRSFYADRGADAFRCVPHYVTNMPFFAQHLARVAAAVLEPLDRPLIVELGAGSGRFGYLFMRALRELRERPFVYRFTDFNQANLAFLREHPRLQPWLQAGVAEVAGLDVTEVPAPPGTDLYLANYLFGALPQDVVRLGDKGLEEGLPTWRLLPPEGDESAIDRLLLPYELEYRPRAPDPALEAHARKVGAGQPFLVPSTALACIESLKGEKPFLLLVADKGVKEPEEWSTWPVPPLARHGASVSFPVDFPLLQGGLPVVGSSPGLRLTGVAHRMAPEQLEAAGHALQLLDTFGPHQLLTLLDAVEGRALSFEQRMLLLEVSRHCPRVLSRLPSWPPLEGEDAPMLLRALEKVEANYYAKPGDDFDLPGHLGRLYHLAGDFGKAARWYRLRLESGRAEPALVTNLALCLYRSGQPREARRLLAQVAAFPPARELALRLEQPPPPWTAPRPAAEPPPWRPELLGLTGSFEPESL